MGTENPSLKDSDKIHEFLMRIPLLSFALIVELAIVAAAFASYLVIRPPFNGARPFMALDLALLTAFWIWHMRFRAKFQGQHFPPFEKIGSFSPSGFNVLVLALVVALHASGIWGLLMIWDVGPYR